MRAAILLAVLAAGLRAQPLISHVTVRKASFNPSRGEKAEISYRLSEEARVTVKVWDGELELVRAMANRAQRAAGPRVESWDGKDVDGAVAPNEAYFFTIEAEDRMRRSAFYDPYIISGGEPADVPAANFNREAGAFRYRLPQPSRVLIRIGVPGGALLRTVLDWEPRPAGDILEQWNGRDESGRIDLWKLGELRALITYFTLPDNSLLAFGNTRQGFREYKASLRGKRESKPVRPQVRPRRLHPRYLDPKKPPAAFPITLSAPDQPAEGGRVMLRVDAPGEVKKELLARPFEIMLYVDGKFLAEEERGYLPFNFPWETAQFTPGEHVVTANIVASQDRMGAAGRVVRVAR